MDFVKMHGIGNDFVLIDARGTERDWPSLARQMCDRHFGVGADGLILVRPSETCDFRMQMFNPDGSEAEMCGNGIRCFPRFLDELGLLSKDTDQITVETLAGPQRLRLFREGGAVARVQVAMGVPRLAPAEIPVALAGAGPILDHPVQIDDHKLALTFVSMGNPHAIAFLDRPVAEFPLEQIGPRVEHHHLFPRRINFEIANVVARDRIDVRVWERGAGITLACGTGACATAVAAHLHGLIDRTVTVALPGGELAIEWDGKGEVLMTGPAETVFAGRWLK